MQENLLRAQFDFPFFCTEILGLDFAEHHKKIASYLKNKQRVLVICARGHGKTELAIAYCLWKVMFNHKLEILVVSSSMDQSSKFLERLKTYIAENDNLRILNPSSEYSDIVDWAQTWNKLEIVTSTKCKIYCRPFNSTIRGVHVDLTICDDILRDDNTNMTEDRAIKLFNEVISPVVESKDGQLFVIGTPQTYTDLLSHLKKKQSYREGLLEIPAIDLNWTTPAWPNKFSVEKLKRIKMDIGSFAFTKEYLIMPVSGENSYFNIEMVKHALANVEHYNRKEGCSYFMGVDIAMSKDVRADYSVFTVIEIDEDGFFNVCWIHREQGMDTARHLAVAKRLNEIFQFDFILWEKKGISYGLVDDAMNDEDLGIISDGFVTARKNKDEILSKLEAGFTRGIIRIPDHEQLIKELSSFRVHRVKDRIKIEGVGEHDDMVMSLAIAYYCASEYMENRVTVSFI